MKILIVPDSFKGTLTSKEVCLDIKSAILQNNNDLIVDYIPFADGGEGFSDCLKEMLFATPYEVDTTDIYYNKIKRNIYIKDDTAIIETALASGLQDKKDIMNASSYGTGTLIKAAYKMGVTKIILGLGGSGMCDGGIGALASLGVKFFDEFDNIISYPVSADMIRVKKVKIDDEVKKMRDKISITYACDVENVLYGKNGASFVFARQKGASDNQIIELDNGLKNLSSIFLSDIKDVKGTGAAGGLCGGLYKVFSGDILSGFDVLSSFSNLEKRIKDADIIITGEGKTDKQTLMGKLPYKIYLLSKKHGKKCFIISGSIENVSFSDKMISLVDEKTPLSLCINEPHKVLINKAKMLLQ